MSFINLRVENNHLIQYIVTFIVGLILPIFSINIQVLIFFIVSVLFMYSFRKYGCLHPISWFPIFFFLYSVVFLFYQQLDRSLTIYSSEIVPISFFGLMGFLAPLIYLREKLYFPQVNIKNSYINFVWFFFAISCLLLILYVLNMGVTTKRDFLDNIGSLGGVFVVFSLLPVIYCIKIIKNKKIDFSDPFLYFTLIILFTAFGVTGERDYFFRFFLFIFLIYFTYTKYYVTYLVLVVFLVFLLMPITQLAKGYLISDGSGLDYTFDWKEVFFGEFFSSGRNLHYILEKNSSYYYGETIIWDIKRFLNFIFPDQMSTGYWFNEIFRVQNGNYSNSGWGFSLVAEGYMNLSIIGVFILYFFIGWMTFLIYRLAGRSIYYFIYYLMYVVVVIYITRADFANYLSLTFKVNLILVFSLFLVFYTLKSLGKRIG